MKSPPELWAEVSDPESLAKHLGEFGGGEIKITRIEPEKTVAWEGEKASGTVEIEPSGWGTKVTLTATVPDVEPPAPAPPAEPEPEPVAIDPDPPAPVSVSADEMLQRAGFFSRIFSRRAEITEPPPPPTPVPEPDPEPEPVEEPMPEPTPLPERDPDPMPPAAVEEQLSSVLDSLGSAHHRPFSRQ